MGDMADDTFDRAMLEEDDWIRDRERTEVVCEYCGERVFTGSSVGIVGGGCSMKRICFIAVGE